MSGALPVTDPPAGDSASAAMHAVSRLLSVSTGVQAPDAIRQRLVEEVRGFFGAVRAVLLAVTAGEGMVMAVAASPDKRTPSGSIAVAEHPPISELLERRAHASTAVGPEALALHHALGGHDFAGTLLLLPMRTGDLLPHVLVLAAEGERQFSEDEIEMGGAFAAAASASLAQMRMAEEHGAQIAQQAALARAAKSLNESLDLNRVLVRISHEAASILDGDNAVVYRGDGIDGVTVDAVHGMPPEAIGYHMVPGEGLAGKVAALDRPLITNDYQGMPEKPDSSLFGEVRSCAAVPMHWDGELRGVLAVGFRREHLVTRAHLSLLEAFGELAAAACRNASAHAGLAHAARTDGLTGCLNHAAMHDALGREIERCRRTGHRLSLVLIDLDDFKQINEEHGHLAGDEVLRRVGHALRSSARQYDLVARYGGDEFAIIAIEADEPAAGEVAGRALRAIGRSLSEIGHRSGKSAATAGVAEWEPGDAPTVLIERADRALLFGKQEQDPGRVIASSDVPPEFGGVRFIRREPARSPGSAEPVAGGWQDRGREQTERLRQRTRQLSLANALGTRLAGMTDPQAIMDATADELHRAFGYFLCAIVRIRDDDFVECAAGSGEAFIRLEEQRWCQPRSAGLIGRCLRERHPVIAGDASEQADYTSTLETVDVRSELVVPLWVGEHLWGVINVEEVRPDAFDEDDARLVKTVADQVGSALGSAFLYERLDKAYVGTAEALAAALEAKDPYTASHSRSVVEHTTAVGTRLGLSGEALRTLRFGAIFHDIGKIAVPEAILNKPGSLTADERRKIEQHTVAGEHILSSVDFLAEVLPLVRHEHERWDGEGYPDGLAGEDIPLGSRIILVCDAYDAMTSDRPYRAAMSDADARAELVANAGTQFDVRVVAAMLQELAAATES